MSVDKLLGDILAELHNLNVNLVAANGLSKKPGATSDPKPAAAQAASQASLPAGTGAASVNPAASPAAADTALTYEQVAEPVNKLVAAGRTGEAKALLGEFGAKSLPQVAKEAWVEFKAKAEALLTGTAGGEGAGLV